MGARVPMPSPALEPGRRPASRGDRVFTAGLMACAIVAATVVLFIIVFVFWESLPALFDVGAHRFVSDSSWHPTEERYNLLPMVAGTLLVTVGAMALAIPLGLASAIFCHQYAPAVLVSPFRRLIQLLAGIPSVVYGFWGLVVLVPIISQWQPPGASLLAGALILCVMVLPTVALTAEIAIAAVPTELVHGAAALGLGTRATLFGVVLPTARDGILSGVFLAIARAVGETMAVLMVCGNVVEFPHSVFDPVRTLTANIALEMAYAMGDHRAALFVSGLVLALFIVVLVLANARLSQRTARA
jgi:phosphate transport system permease protein